MLHFLLTLLGFMGLFISVVVKLMCLPIKQSSQQAPQQSSPTSHKN